VQTGNCEQEIDVSKTFNSGALYHWWRDDRWYETTVEGGFLRVSNNGKGMVYESEGVPDKDREDFLGLSDDLGEVEKALSGDDIAEGVFEKHRGLRIPRDDPFASVVSFIGSTQNRNERTRGIVRRLCERHGKGREGWKAYTFPSPETVSELSEQELRRLGFGYRAPYVADTSDAVANGDIELATLHDVPYTEAHEELNRLKGIGNKVADCVLLFSLGFLNVVALDTWLKRIIDEHYPELKGDGYEETACGFRELFDGYAGYAQTYLYHEARTGDGDVFEL